MSALEHAPRTSARLGMKHIAVGALLIALGAVATLALVRETRAVRQDAVRQEIAPAAAPQIPERPPLTAAEERYAQALWEVHSGVRTEAVRMAFAGISYKTHDIDQHEVKNRVLPLTKIFGDALHRVEAIEAPASLQQTHVLYVQALQLLRDSSLEMVKVAADGKDEHLLKAHGMSERASSISWRSARHCGRENTSRIRT